MRALVTNDDGVDSPGIQLLAGVGHERGLEVIVVAPAWDTSGASASLTAVQHDGQLRLDPRSYAGLPDVDVYAVEAAPAFIVRAAAAGAFGPPPDVVLSGINNGPNTGHAILHSGTVGAALTAATFGLRAMAVSIGAAPQPHWATGAAYAKVALDWLLDADEPAVLNVNVPDLPVEDVREFEHASLAAFGAVQTNITDAGEGYVKLAYEEVAADYEPGTDAAALRDGRACYTPLIAVCEARTDIPATLGDLQETRGGDRR
jgi:5'-nucleotidase